MKDNQTGRRAFAIRSQPAARSVPRASYHGPPRLPAALRPGRGRGHRGLLARNVAMGTKRDVDVVFCRGLDRDIDGFRPKADLAYLDACASGVEHEARDTARIGERDRRRRIDRIDHGQRDIDLGAALSRRRDFSFGEVDIFPPMRFRQARGTRVGSAQKKRPAEERRSKFGRK